jgi:hypothetical protein
MRIMRKMIVVGAVIIALPAIAFVGSKYAPCSLWKEIGFRPAWAVTCCCRVMGGGMCCGDAAICTGSFIPGCFCSGALPDEESTAH